MPRNKRAQSRPKRATTRPKLPPSLSKTEQDLLWHMSHGYQLETSSLRDNPILRRLKDNTKVRATANRRTIETLQQRGLITVAKAGAVLHPTVWRLAAKARKEIANGPEEHNAMERRLIEINRRLGILAPRHASSIGAMPRN